MCCRAENGRRTPEGAPSLSQAFTRQQQELEREAKRSLCLQNENVQFEARVSALESALKMQQVSFVSCLEESERARLQQRAACPHSPVSQSEWCLRQSEATEEAAAEVSFCLAPGGGSEASYDANYDCCITPEDSRLGTQRHPLRELPSAETS